MWDLNVTSPPTPTLHFLLPLAERLRKVELRSAVCTLGLISLGLYAHYWLLRNVSGFRSPSSALLCMFVSRSLLAHPYLHVNIFQVRPPRLGPRARLGVLGKEREASAPHLPPPPLCGLSESGFQVESLLLFTAGCHSPFTCGSGMEDLRNFSA